MAGLSSEGMIQYRLIFLRRAATCPTRHRPPARPALSAGAATGPQLQRQDCHCPLLSAHIRARPSEEIGPPAGCTYRVSLANPLPQRGWHICAMVLAVLAPPPPLRPRDNFLVLCHQLARGVGRWLKLLEYVRTVPIFGDYPPWSPPTAFIKQKTIDRGQRCVSTSLAISTFEW